MDLYCGCAYDETGAIDAESCGYERRGPGARGGRIEWARVVPAARFGAHRDCWDDPDCSETGRECCARPVERGGDQQFRWMLGDMHNLVPVIGELNADRSDRDYGLVEGEPRDYGACDFEIDRASADGLVEPPEAVRGDVARIWLYMDHTYPHAIEMTEEEFNRLMLWSVTDPPDAWERERDARIEAIQGTRNGFLGTEEGYREMRERMQIDSPAPAP